MCKDKHPNLCLSMIKKLGERVCHGKWFTDPTGRYGCEKTCNCCYEKKCTCSDRNEEECKKYVKLFGKKNCKHHWFTSYTGKYGCRKSCGLCSKWAHGWISKSVKKLFYTFIWKVMMPFLDHANRK